MKLGKIEVTKEKDIINVRNAVKLICSKIGFNNIETIKITTAASELTRNLYEHAFGGDIIFELLTKDSDVGLKLTFQDAGPGITNVDKILGGQVKSKTGMGIGLMGAKKLMDDFQIDTSDKGTKIDIIKWHPVLEISFKNLVSETGMILANASEESAIESLKDQNRELVVILGELREKNIAFEAANDELEEKNIKLSEYMDELQRSTIEIRDTVTELEQTNKEMELFVETIPDGILVLNIDGKVKIANKTFQKYYEDITNQKFPPHLDLSDQPVELNLFLAALKDILTKNEEINRTINPIENLWLQIVSKLVRINKRSAPFAIIIELRDVTPFIEFDNLRKQFVSTVSHELRTPITSINLSINNLLKYKDKMDHSTKDNLLNIIAESAAVLSEMIEDLLILSRLDSRKFDIHFEKYALRKILDSVIFQLDVKMKNKSITLEMDCDDSIELLGDPTRLSQVFRILIDNAIKYSPDSSKIEIKTHNHYRGEYNYERAEGCLVKIIDQGIGIKKEDQSRIFERFFRAEEVQEIDGTGLGLPIAKELLSLHESDIYVESEYKKGSTFIIFLKDLNV